MQPPPGWAPRGQRATAFAPHSHYVSVTMFAAVRLSGPSAAQAFAGAMNAVRFRHWVKRQLAPTLHSGEVVVRDNLSTHKTAAAREIIEAAGARVLFLPPYSPDLNPLEKHWSKTKQLLRQWQERTMPKLLRLVTRVVKKVTPSDCRGFFQSCNYATY